MQRVRIKYAGATRFHVSHPAFASRVDRYGRRSDEFESGAILEIADHWTPEDFRGMRMTVEFLSGEPQSEQPVEDQAQEDAPERPDTEQSEATEEESDAEV